MESETIQWLELAALDRNVAKHLFDTYHPGPIEIICYHCQQAAEKAVKAIIISLGSPGGLPKKHDISFLLSQIKNYVAIEEKYYDYADTLTPYGVAIRYPHELRLDEHHAQKAIQYALEIIEWEERVINKSSPDAV